jgi:dipeptidyl aminopeptidase/acylaminoacyl peptidase
MRFKAASSLILAATIMTISNATAQSLPIPKSITDPKQLQTTTVTDLQNFSIEKLYMTRAVGGSTWSPDGKQVAFITNISGRANLWIVSADGGWPTQLTISDQRQSSPAWSPDGKWIAYQSDKDGNEMWDIFLVSPTSGEVVNLTTSALTAEEHPVWSPDGKQIAYMTKAKTSPSFEIDIIEVESRKTRHITHESPRDIGNVDPVWSKDGKLLAWTQVNASGKKANVLVADLTTGNVTNLTNYTTDIVTEAVEFSPDARKLLVDSNEFNGYQNVGLLDLATKKIEWLTQDKWEIAGGGFSPDGRQVTWTANVDGNEGIYIHDFASGKLTSLPLPAGVNILGGSDSAYTKDGARLLYYHNGPTSPNDLWSFDLKSQSTTQITHSLVAGVRSADMVEPTLVHYPSRDGKWTISAWAYIPHNIERNAKFPAIVYIHGGPISQSVNNFNRIVQYMVNQGYVVIAPNYRGGSGYGREFQDANRMDAGGGELHDVLDAAEFIKQSGFVNPRKMIVMGGSYGGYLSMMAVTKAPEMWAAAVPIVPFVNWFTEFQNEDPQLQESDRLFMGDPVKDKALWTDRSPINFIHQVKAPILLLAGGNDPRCPKTEAQQVADAIKKQGGVAQLKIYDNEGHGFARVENQIDAYQRVSDFLKVHVPSPGCGKSGPCSIYE